MNTYKSSIQKWLSLLLFCFLVLIVSCHTNSHQQHKKDVLRRQNAQHKKDDVLRQRHEHQLSDSDCKFCEKANRKANGETHSDNIYHEDEFILAFESGRPHRTNVHILVIPKKHIRNLKHASTDDEWLLGQIQVVIGDLGRQYCPEGFRVHANAGKDAAQSVFHLHYHIRGGEILDGFHESRFKSKRKIESESDSDMNVYECTTLYCSFFKS